MRKSFGIIAALLLATALHAQTLGPVPQVGAGFSTAPETANGVFNANSSTLGHWRKVSANVRAGLGRGLIDVIGDSTSMGAGAGASGTTDLVGAWAVAWSQTLATQLNAYIPTTSNSFYNDQGITTKVTINQYDPRITLGAGWSSNATGGLGGSLYKFTTGSATALTFVPVGAFDTIQVWYVINTGSGGGSFTVDVDGGSSLGTVTTTGASSVGSHTFTVAATTHTIHINAQNDANFFFIGIVTKNSTVPGIDLLQTAQYGATASTFDFSASAWSPLPALGLLAPDLTIINLTINDSNASTDIATYTTQMQAIITEAKVSGDCLLMVGPPSNTSQATNGTLDQYIAVVKSLAITNSCAMLDLKQRWTSYAVTNPLLPYFDNLHPEAAGYQDVAVALREILSSP